MGLENYVSRWVIENVSSTARARFLDINRFRWVHDENATRFTSYDAALAYAHEFGVENESEISEVLEPLK